jgi:hypothetical protein
VEGVGLSSNQKMVEELAEWGVVLEKVDHNQSVGSRLHF